MDTPSFVFLGADAPWTYPLARELAADGHPVAAIAPYDWQTFRRLRPRWPEGKVPATLRRAYWVLPPGYAGGLAAWFAPLLRWRLARAMPGTPWVVVFYPWHHRAVRGVPDGRLIYYNVDDYTLYRPERADLVRQQEDELLSRAALTVCVSRQQMEALRTRVPPDRANRIVHSPHGVEDAYLNPHPERVPTARTVGYVGNLIDRVDWRLVGETARALPDMEFVFVGGPGGAGGGGVHPDWETQRAAALALPNVRRVGPVPQAEVPDHYWNFRVNWIPYATDHPFNRASSPTKIMDGLASGRPMVSTDLPECRLYPDWITLARDAPEMIAALTRVMDAATDPVRAGRQVAFAHGNTWTNRARALLVSLPASPAHAPP